VLPPTSYRKVGDQLYRTLHPKRMPPNRRSRLNGACFRAAEASSGLCLFSCHHIMCNSLIALIDICYIAILLINGCFIAAGNYVQIQSKPLLFERAFRDGQNEKRGSRLGCSGSVYRHIELEIRRLVRPTLYAGPVGVPRQSRKDAV
jgi:hypothetical protein